jgi:hypothetical protein
MPQGSCEDQRRRRAGSRRCRRASASGDVGVAGQRCHRGVAGWASRVAVLAPAWAAWVSAECRSWCSVHGPPGQATVACSNSSAARRYDSRAAGGRVEVAGWQRDAGAPVGYKHRAGPAALEQPRQQPRRCRSAARSRRPRCPCGGLWRSGCADPARRRRGRGPRGRGRRSHRASAAGFAPAGRDYFADEHPGAGLGGEPGSCQTSRLGRGSAAGTTAACRRRPCRGEVPSTASGGTPPPGGRLPHPPSSDNSALPGTVASVAVASEQT